MFIFLWFIGITEPNKYHAAHCSGSPSWQDRRQEERREAVEDKVLINRVEDEFLLVKSTR
jgi:hypothetical protein